MGVAAIAAGGAMKHDDEHGAEAMADRLAKDAKGLGGKASIYQKQRQTAVAASQARTGFSTSAKIGNKPSEFAFQEEYLFFMCTFIFTQCTYFPYEEQTVLRPEQATVRFYEPAPEGMDQFDFEKQQRAELEAAASLAFAFACEMTRSFGRTSA